MYLHSNCMYYCTQVNLYIIDNRQVSSLRGQGHYHFLKGTFIGKVYQELLKGHQRQDQGNKGKTRATEAQPKCQAVSVTLALFSRHYIRQVDDKESHNKVGKQGPWPQWCSRTVIFLEQSVLQIQTMHKSTLHVDLTIMDRHVHKLSLSCAFK